MEPSKNTKRPFGAPRRGPERVYLSGVVATLTPAGALEGVDASLWDEVAWLLQKPADVTDYDLQLYVYSTELDAWLLVEERSNVTTSLRINQEANTRVAVGISGINGTVGDGFNIAYFTFNRA